MLLHAKSLQSCLTLCNPMDCSQPGSSVHGILQARILEWVAMPSSRGYCQPRDQTQVSYVSCIGRWVLYHYRHLGYALESSQNYPPATPGLGKNCLPQNQSLVPKSLGIAALRDPVVIFWLKKTVRPGFLSLYFWGRGVCVCVCVSSYHDDSEGLRTSSLSGP